MLFENLPEGKFRCVEVDPPWQYQDNLPGKGRGATKHYRTLTVAEVAMLPIPDLAEDDAHLWVWTTNQFMRETFSLIEHWGFTFKAPLTWGKTTDDGLRPRIGMGHYLRNNTEHCFMAVRGKLPALSPRNVPSYFLAPRGRHSHKPDEAYRIIRRVSPGPYLSLFQRTPREEFVIWGDQAPEGQADAA
jgi:N6-adenosine-specific RNA methylase IME4